MSLVDCVCFSSSPGVVVVEKVVAVEVAEVVVVSVVADRLDSFATSRTAPSRLSAR